MTRARLLLCILLAFVPASGHAQEEELTGQEVRILVPVFAGDARLGKTVANLLRLQISQTFQVAGTNTTGVLILKDQPLAAAEQANAQAAGMAPGALCHVVLWGQVYRYRDGVALETHLTTTPWLSEGRVARPEIWEIAVPGTEFKLRSELPREVYELPTTILGNDAAQHYADFDGLVIYRDRSFTQPIGRFRNTYRAHRYWADAAYVTSNGITGYVPLPHVAAARGETVDFVAAYIRLLRGDWPGSTERLRKLLANGALTPEIAVDTRLFLGLIEEKLGRSGLAYFEQALAFNPYDRAASAYLLMGRLTEVQRARGAARAAALDRMRADRDRYRPLFPDDSQWLRMMERIMQYYAGSNS